jgi:SPP1 family predicted phage head-tail adaptor
VIEFLPSDLRHRLTLEELRREEDEGGGFTEIWVELAELSADLRPLGGSETVEADRLAGRVSHEVSLRYWAGVQPSMRFRKGARLFHIVTVIDVEERKRWLKCLWSGSYEAGGNHGARGLAPEA